jgi:hypothetical protein
LSDPSHEDTLERALRALPPLAGEDDWPDLKRRLGARRTFRSRLRRSRSTLRWVAACLTVLLAVGAWQTLQGRRSVVASSGLELRTWTRAHQEAVQHDPLADPWAEALAEASP